MTVQLVPRGRTILSDGQKVLRSYYIVHGEVAVKETFSKASTESDQPFHLRNVGECVSVHVCVRKCVVHIFSNNI